MEENHEEYGIESREHKNTFHGAGTVDGYENSEKVRIAFDSYIYKVHVDILCKRQFYSIERI
jgi:hypothetical protein